jgi:DNA modification methylase
MRNTQGSVRLSWSGRREPQPLEAPTVAPIRPIPDHPTGLLMHADNTAAAAFIAQRQRHGQLPSVNLLYIDPPYAMDAHHFIERDSGGGAANADRLAYSDVWDDAGHYLQFMYDRLAHMPDLLAEDGVICVHCDWRANAWLRLLLDEVFGRDCFRNEIIWRRAPNVGHQAAAKQLGRTADTLLVYSRTPGTSFRGKTPVRSTPVELTRTGRPRGAKWDEEAQVWFTTAPRGDYTDASIAQLRAQGRVYDSPSGRVYIKYPLRRGEDGRWYKDQPVDTIWADEAVRPLRHASKAELAIGYPTQKPEALLRRIIEWTTRPGDLVADLFCGSGTTLAVAEKLGRRWVGCDVGQAAIETTMARLDALDAHYEALAAVGAAPQALASRPPRARRVSTPGTA